MATTTLTMTVTLTLTPREGQTPEEAKEEFAALFEDYLTEPMHPFREDYGPDAWGGYEGPFVTDVAVE